MNCGLFGQFIRTITEPSHLNDLLSVVNSTKQHVVFIKNEHGRYLFANSNCMQLMGLNSFQQLRRTSDDELLANTTEAKKLLEINDYVLEEGQILQVSEPISPRHHKPLTKTMEGKLYPLFTDGARAKYTMGIALPQTKLLKLDWDSVFGLSSSQLDSLLVKRSYPIHLDHGQITLSKMEIKTLVQLLKGEHSGEIADSLRLKQTTVESYLKNIKNKLGVSLKTELIHQVIDSKLLEQIII